MELLESYLNEVGRFLPNEERANILVELRDDILNEIEGRMAGRADTEQAEVEVEVLAGFGHPIKIAGRYQPQKYVIGPELYPVFIHTLKVVLSMVVVLQVVVSLIYAASTDWQIGPFSLFDMTFDLLIWALVVVFAVFIALQFSSDRLNWYKNWQPQQLSHGNLGVINRSDVITNLLSEGFFLLWFNDIVVFQNLLALDGGAITITLAEVWQNNALYFNIVFAALFVNHAYVLVRGVWQRATLLIEVVASAALLALLAAILLSPDILIISGDVGENLVNLGEKLFLNVHRILQITILVVAGFTFWDIWTAIRNFRGSGVLSL